MFCHGQLWGERLICGFSGRSTRPPTTAITVRSRSERSNIWPKLSEKTCGVSSIDWSVRADFSRLPISSHNIHLAVIASTLPSVPLAGPAIPPCIGAIGIGVLWGGRAPVCGIRHGGRDRFRKRGSPVRTGRRIGWPLLSQHWGNKAEYCGRDYQASRHHIPPATELTFPSSPMRAIKVPSHNVSSS
jgi:hypothetical protein